MTRMLCLATWIALIGASLGAAQGIQRFEKIPPEGVVLAGPQRFERARIGPKYKVMPWKQTAQLPTWDSLQSKPPAGVFNLDRQRRHERDKALRGRGFMSVFKSVVADKLGDKLKEKKRR